MCYQETVLSHLKATNTFSPKKYVSLVFSRITDVDKAIIYSKLRQEVLPRDQTAKQFISHQITESCRTNGGLRNKTFEPSEVHWRDRHESATGLLVLCASFSDL